MKKTTLALASLLSFSAMTSPIMAQEMSPTSTDQIYDFSGWDEQKILDLFYNALQQNRQFPTLDEFATIGIQEADLAFVRSHVRKREIMDRSNSLSPNTYKERELWMNIPLGTAKGTGGYPDSNFANDVYSVWNYTNVFGQWNHGLFQGPAAVVDAAHKNGTDIYSGIKFFESWTQGSGAGGWASLIQTFDDNEPSGFKYVRPLINCLRYFGSDGINYNWEDQGYNDPTVIKFHQALYKEAEAQNFKNFHIGMYTANSSLSTRNAGGLFGNQDGKTADCFLNYQGGDFTGSRYMEGSVNTAKQVLGTAQGLYTGVWIVSMNRSWTSLVENPEIGICLWGEHAQSRFFSYNSGADAYEAQENYQRLLERGVSGGNRNPLDLPKVKNGPYNWEFNGTTPPLDNFHGLASHVSERSAIQGNLPFSTHFTLGNGDRYYYKGKTSFNGGWYNMGAQDVVPTYRWYVADANTATAANNIEVNYTHKDAYIGGSCLRLTGKSTAAGTDIVLYQTNLKVSAAGPYVKLALKNLKEGKNASNLMVILKKAGLDEWIEVPYGDLDGKTWQEKEIKISGLSEGETIEKIGLRVKGADDNYMMLVGKLEINDNSQVITSEIADLKVEVKEETQSTMGIKAFWTVNGTQANLEEGALVYNDDVNVDHFELLYKVGENGRVSEIARTTSWADYVGGIRFESADDQPYVGVRAVSTDLKNYSEVKWVKVERAAQDALPAEKQEDSYGVSAMDPNCEGAATARKERYVTELKTTGATADLNYKATGPVADGSQYADMRDMVLEVEQGQEVTLYFKCAAFGDGLKYCFAGGWMDFDGSGDFNHPKPVKGTQLNPAEETDPLGECIFKLGKLRASSPEFQNEGVSCTFTIPEDAHVGDSRLRIVFSDAWFAGQFLPTGLHAKGFTIDFGVKINGDETHQRGAVDTRDQGLADEPQNLEGTQTGIETVAGEVSTAKVEGRVLVLDNVEKAWIYSADGKFVKLAETETVSLEGLVPGAYVVKMLNKNVFRSSKFVVK